MDRQVIIIRTVLFIAADILAIASLAMPDWIISQGGEIRLGLMLNCMTLYNGHEVCLKPELTTEWLMVLICIFIGCFCSTATIILLVASTWYKHLEPYAHWIGFTAMVFFSLAGVIFPLGFHSYEIGGRAYHLPYTYSVGVCYCMFVLASWITAISELFAGKICIPNLD